MLGLRSLEKSSAERLLAEGSTQSIGRLKQLSSWHPDLLFWKVNYDSGEGGGPDYVDHGSSSDKVGRRRGYRDEGR